MAIKIIGTTVIDDSRNALNLTSVTSTGSITADSDGNIITLSTDGGIEIFRTGGGAYIDFKNSSSEDYDVRLSNTNNTNNLVLDGNFESAGTIKGTSITGSSFTVSGGTSSQFLKANGTTDSTNYSTAVRAFALSRILN